MPGFHTFYDGSTLLQPLADGLGIEVDKVNLVVCQFISLPIAYIHYTLLSPSRVSQTVRVAFPAVTGLIFCYFCYGNAMKHLASLIGLSYAIMHLSSPTIVHKCVFLFSMCYLVFIHWYRWYILSTYSIDVTGPMMIAVQKVSALAFSLHDGKVKKTKELNEIQKREALTSVPSPLYFISYMFHFQAVLTGPVCFYTDYLSWLQGTNAIGKDGKVERPWRAVGIKLIQTFTFLLLYILFDDYFYPELVIKDDSMRMNWLSWLLMFYLVMLFQRIPYYFAWTLADAIFNMSGFGFNGYDARGHPQWDFVSNVNIWGVESALNFKETLDSWNCCTMYWLRRVAYDRAPKKYRTLATYLLSAVWHGFFFGYYVTFLTGALFTVAARSARRCLRWRFQRNAKLKRFYDLLTFLLTKFALAYTTYPFVTMHLAPGLYLYKRMYFCLHILALFAILILPLILSKEPQKEELKPMATNANENKKTL